MLQFTRQLERAQIAQLQLKQELASQQVQSQLRIAQVGETAHRDIVQLTQSRDMLTAVCSHLAQDVRQALEAAEGIAGQCPCMCLPMPLGLLRASQVCVFSCACLCPGGVLSMPFIFLTVPFVCLPVALGIMLSESSMFLSALISALPVAVCPLHGAVHGFASMSHSAVGKISSWL